jgi:hypothetical protein
LLSRTVVLSAVLLVLVGCADPPPTRPRNGAETSVAASAADEPAADVARIVCSEDTVLVETPMVRAQRDGVHLAFDNPEHLWGFELRHESAPHGSSVGGAFQGRSDTTTFSLRPGEWTVACLRASDSAYYDPEAATALLTVVDPNSLYVPWDLSCGFGEQFRMKVAVAEDEKAEGVFRRVSGVRPTDEFRKPNYPDSPQYGPTVIVFRDGVAVARIMSFDFGTHPEASLLVNACPGSGITKS